MTGANLVVIVGAMLLAGCGDHAPTGSAHAVLAEGSPRSLRPVRSIAYPTVHNAVRDGDFEIHLDSATGELRLNNVYTGQAVYAMPDAEMLAGIANFIEAARIGDANSNALEGLQPWQNQPGGPEPMSVPGDELSSDGTFGSQPLRGSKASSDRTALPQVLIRKAGRVETSGSPSSVRDRGLLGERSLSLEGPWDPRCPDFAQAIAVHRLSYLQRRTSAVRAIARNALEVPASALQWHAGKPYISFENLQSLYVSAAVDLVESVHTGLQLNIMRVAYNGAYCQQAIVVQAPHPGSTFVGPFPRGSSGGGGGGDSVLVCEPQSFLYEISFDGGGTWYPFIVTRNVCVHLMT